MSSLTDLDRSNWQSVRSRAAYGLDALTGLGKLCPGHLQESAGFLVIANVCLPDWLDGVGRVRPANITTRSIKTFAVSQSLNRPFETVRRHISWLVDQSLINTNGYELTLSTGSRSEEILQFLQSRYDSFLMLMDRLFKADDLSPIHHSMINKKVLYSRVLKAALDLDLVPFEFNPSLHKYLERSAIYSGFAHLGTRHILNNIELSEKYRFINTPDDERVKCSISEVAKLVCVPYTSARRQTLELFNMGLLSSNSERKWTVSSNDLIQKELHEGSRRYFAYLRSKITSLVKLA